MGRDENDTLILKLQVYHHNFNLYKEFDKDNITNTTFSFIE